MKLFSLRIIYSVKIASKFDMKRGITCDDCGTRFHRTCRESLCILHHDPQQALGSVIMQPDVVLVMLGHRIESLAAVACPVPCPTHLQMTLKSVCSVTVSCTLFSAKSEQFSS